MNHTLKMLKDQEHKESIQNIKINKNYNQIKTWIKCGKFSQGCVSLFCFRCLGLCL